MQDLALIKKRYKLMMMYQELEEKKLILASQINQIGRELAKREKVNE